MKLEILKSYKDHNRVQPLTELTLTTRLPKREQAFE